MRHLRLTLATVAAVALALTSCSSAGDHRSAPGTSARPGPPSASGPASAGGSPSVGADPATRAKKIVAGMSDVELVGQVLMPYAYGDDANHVSAASAKANQNIAGVSTPAELVAKYHVGGLILVSFSADDPTGGTNPTTNVESPAQVRRLTDGLHEAAGSLPPLIGTDQEFGVVTRVRSGVVQLPTGMGLGAAHDPALTTRAWQAAGEDLAALGVNVDFAPDADVTEGADNAVIGSRSFGSDPAKVSAQVAAAVRGLQAAGVAATPKHFPGHGHTSVDSHEGLPVLSRSLSTLEREDLPPFAAAAKAGTWAMMSGHLEATGIDAGLPATLSHKAITGVLRDELHYDGVVVTDALNMGALTDRYSAGQIAVQAIAAGNDLLLMPTDLPGAQRDLLGALHSGELKRSRLVEAATRVVTLRTRLAVEPQPALSTVDSAAHRAVADQAAAAAVTLLRGPCSGALVHGPVRVTASAGNGAKATQLAADLRALGVSTVDSGGTRVHLTGYGDGPGDLARADVTVGMDTPYVLGSADSRVVLDAFGGTAASLRAVAAVLAGRAKAPGTSPVAVPHLPRHAC